MLVVVVFLVTSCENVIEPISEEKEVKAVISFSFQSQSEESIFDRLTNLSGFRVRVSSPWMEEPITWPDGGKFPVNPEKEKQEVEIQVPIGTVLIDVVFYNSLNSPVMVGSELFEVDEFTETVALSVQEVSKPIFALEHIYSFASYVSDGEEPHIKKIISSPIRGPFGTVVDVDDLTLSDFVVIEDNIPRPLISLNEASSTVSKVDIAFILDVTGSMSEEIGGVRNSVISLAEELGSSGFDVRFAAVPFRDDVVTPVFDFSDDVEEFREFISTLSASGGGDWPEDDLDAIAYAYDNLSFEEGAQKVFILLTDAPAHERGDGTPYASYTLDELVAHLRGEVPVHVVGPAGLTQNVNYLERKPDNSPYFVENQMMYVNVSQIAERTGGIFMTMPADGNVDLTALPIIELITNAFSIEYKIGTISKEEHRLKICYKPTFGIICQGVVNLYVKYH